MESGATRENERASGTSVRIYLPDERLRSFATFYYFVECFDELEDFLYPEWGNVRFSIAGSWWVQSREVRGHMPVDGALFGATDRAARVVSRGGKTAGFGLTPLGWQRLFDVPADALANRIAPLCDRMGRPAHTITTELVAHRSDEQGVALFDALLFELLATRPPNTPDAIAVDAALRDRPRTVAAFAEAAGTDRRALDRVCKRVFGFGPKRLLKRQRFLDTLGRVRYEEHPRFDDLRDPEYYDQSHFNHEFHEFMGLSPREYLSAPRPLMGQAALVQLQAGIPLSFKLPPPPEELG
ncbi:helix-turn-helix domain-containing protein [Sphingomonas lenta]|uniref:HTH araC/xylS-type domain-containing protein n=1 Tax=Sphingomonas lenta TaxID=1141887 RepID=A0A2A2SGX8_9SPHN|nr:AraC family transcriptional regulator [Sphingomonas lenta]PAX08517.1 hypothetical protein CKY28_03805 [Sphingomonas lenta]